MDLRFVHSVKVNPEISISFQDGNIYIDVPSLHQRLEVTLDTLMLLQILSSEDKETALLKLSGEYSLDNLRTIVEDLLGCNLLVKTGHTFDYSEKWKDWKKTTWSFHLDSRDVIFTTTPGEENKYIDYILKATPPAIYKCACEQTELTYKLPPPAELKPESLTDVFFKRRTCRNFLDVPVDLEKLSTVLYYTGGALFEAETTRFGKALIKSAPSPGGRHSTEIYVYVRKCGQMREGIYHYCVKHHALDFITQVESTFLKKAIFNQAYFEQASVVFFFTTVVDRMIWKYKTTKAYRQLHFEIGHYCQNLLLAGTALDLAVFQTGALHDSYVESYLRINGCDEFLMYCAGVGIEDPLSEPIESAVRVHDFFQDSTIRLPKKNQRYPDDEM